ncbi:MAG TPA: 6-bladed beta-propeller [Candidatus Krumholzibacteria bacterium]|nr:6-bladed beta-propeller [Candidatus Krumholzibacteria bacterium]
MTNTRLLSLASASALTLAITAPLAFAGSWMGREETKDGVVHVLNPGIPTDGSFRVTPHKVWSAGGDDDEDTLFGVISDVDVDDKGNVYALDQQLSQVNVFAPDGHLLRTIGREGEGPGEFRRANVMFLMPNGNVAVLQQMPGKLVVFTPDGKPVDFQGPKGADGGMIAYMDGGRAGDGLVLSLREFAQKPGAFSNQKSLVVFDASGKPRATLYQNTVQQDPASMMNFDEKEMRSLAWAGGPDGRVYTSENFDAYEIKVFSPEGKLERVIDRDYSHRSRSMLEMEAAKPHIRIRANGQNVKPQINSSSTDRDIMRMIARADGTLWVLSSHGALDGSAGIMATFDVFDAKGRYVRTLTFDVPGDFKQDDFHIAGDQVVVVKSAKSARDAFMGDGDDSKPAADVEPVSLVSYRFDNPATAQK